MQANEVVRFHCGDCQVIFDLCVRGVSEIEDTGGAPPVIDFGDPEGCPFCGADELARVPDEPIIAGQ